jgi:hypothetical protein
MEASLVERILDQLELAEASELNPHFQDDYRIAWIIVLRASHGIPEPHVSASYAVLGLHPDNVWPSIVARRRAQLGPYYEEFFGVELPPKKPAASVRVVPRKAFAQAA